MKKYLFRNDYSFGTHPKVLEVASAVNLEGNHGYGDDESVNRVMLHRSTSLQASSSWMLLPYSATTECNIRECRQRR